MAVDLPEIDCVARAAAWAVDVQPRHAGDQRRPDPSASTACRDRGPSASARAALSAASRRLHVETPRSNPHDGLSRPCVPSSMRHRAGWMADGLPVSQPANTSPVEPAFGSRVRLRRLRL